MEMMKVGMYWLPVSESTAHFLYEFKHKDGWHSHRIKQALTLLQNFRVGIDGGAHVGSWTKFMAERFDTVHSFDFNKENFECLEKNIKEWGIKNVITHNCGLGEVHEFVSVELDKKWPKCTGGWHVSGPGNLPVIPLDDLNLKDVDFIKLDIEGYEEKALIGAKNTIEKYNPLIMIEHKRRMNIRYSEDPDADIHYLDKIGYTIYCRCGSDWIYRRT